MHRFQRIREFWQWLPAFRAVAESEHLPTAARQMDVTPSALSRSMRQLEAVLGTALFERNGRRLMLTPSGRDFLTAVLDAFRDVHCGLERLAGDGLQGCVRIASSGAISSAFVLPALASLRAEHPQLSARIVTRDPGAVGAQLRRGDLDVALRAFPLNVDGLVSEPIGAFAVAVFCAPGHPLAARGVVSIEELTEQPFVGPFPDEHGNVHDGWPVHGPKRRFALHVDDQRLSVDACLAGGLLAVLPRALGAAPGQPLTPLQTEPGLPDRPLLAVRLGRPAGWPTACDAVLAAVRSQLDGAS
ncbi:MAG: LysR family transcriptional regulator [Planctomycetes bacterium]|nr:LysR family transcriptional regulator [Planctomycetota bacterium]